MFDFQVNNISHVLLSGSVLIYPMFLFLGALIFIMSMPYRIACRDFLRRIGWLFDCRAVCVPRLCSLALHRVCIRFNYLDYRALCFFTSLAPFNYSVAGRWSDAADLDVLKE